jgi:hypothetical protein
VPHLRPLGKVSLSEAESACVIQEVELNFDCLPKKQQASADMDAQG